MRAKRFLALLVGPIAAGGLAFMPGMEPQAMAAPHTSAAVKAQTTVAMDFGRITIDKDLVLYLFGTPGQRRFDFMWEILSEGMLGLVVLVDSTRPETFRETLRIIDFFNSYRPMPYLVAANKQDEINAWKPDEVRLALRLPREVKVLPLVAKDREQVKSVLLELLYTILAMTED